MEAPRLSVAMPEAVRAELESQVTRDDGQEDLTFFLWKPSIGRSRATALVTAAVLPQPSERHVHGNVSFEDDYFLRAAAAASESGSGIGLIHSHPGGVGWQSMSKDDYAAESGHSAQAEVLTGLPMLGMTYAGGDGHVSARFWQRRGARTYEPQDCESVRAIGAKLGVSFNPKSRPAPATEPTQSRTVSAWGESVQADLVRLRVGVIGAGSVGALVAEGLARIGIRDLMIMDFDTVELHNLDRLIHATRRDVEDHRSKVEVLAVALESARSASSFEVSAHELSVVEPQGFELALDQDVLFCCVDRPWPRAVLNLVAYAHLIPVIDGGVAIDVANGRMKGAEWRAHVAAPGRRCLECLGQYDPADVGTERLGYLEEPSYIQNLPADARRNFAGENVFNLSMAAAAAELNQFISMIVAPSGIADVGAQLFHFTTGTVDLEAAGCEDGCLYSTRLLAQGEATGLEVTGPHPLAARHRAQRDRAVLPPESHRQSRLRWLFRRAFG
ncbi:MAG: ThiF family adenylyltransferase [Candidatus Dormibacteraeota bacterium]|nr:ThiF family adenylyltransferase [Candidatus Dormibacteraeota bacterium]